MILVLASEFILFSAYFAVVYYRVFRIHGSIVKKISITFVVIMFLQLVLVTTFFLVEVDTEGKNASLNELLTYVSIFPAKEVSHILFFFFLFKMKLIEIQLTQADLDVDGIMRRIRKL